MGSQPKGISGSRASAVLGLSEFQSQFEVWQRICEERRPGFNAKRGYAMPEDPDNSAIRFGLAFETAIIHLAEAAHGCCIIDREREFERGEYHTCHVDGIYLDGIMHEGKSTNMFSYWEGWGDPGTDRVPQSYQVQAQSNMLASGMTRAIISVLILPRRTDEFEAEGVGVDSDFSMIDTIEWAIVMNQMGLFKQYPIDAIPSLQLMLTDAFDHFWKTYVLPEKEPEIDKYSDVRRAFPQPKGTIVADEQTARWASEYKAIGEEIGGTGRLARRREELKVLIVDWMRNADKTIDDESRERTVLRDSTGTKLASFDGKTFLT